MANPVLQTGAPVDPGSSSSKLKLIAIYLPQFHPIPENNEWWGKGFTEWTNVTRAKPLFAGHHQPDLPADLGFYDLRVPETRQAQADLARESGIHGFCYYHYWFHGKRLLETPFNEVLASGQPDFPFCLCWANESWTRAWLEKDRDILIEQTYSKEDDLNHIRWLISAFKDRRYIRVEGKPLFLVYRSGDLPHARQTADLWREEARKAGIADIFLCTFQGNHKESQMDPADIGFDAAVELQPFFLFRRNVARRIWGRMLRKLFNKPVFTYSEIANRAMGAFQPAYRRFRTVTPGWDNTPRRGASGLVLRRTSPAKYAEWLESAIRASRPLSTAERLVFINAWNEWAEGNHLEPCQRWGKAYLDATKAVVDALNLKGF